MAAVTETISKLAKLPPLQSRAAASILGAVVADAAARPLHWVYDRDAFGAHVGNVHESQLNES